MKKRDPLLQKTVNIMVDAIAQGVLKGFEAKGTPQYGRPWSLYPSTGGKFYARSVMDVLTILKQIGYERDTEVTA